ncbi:MAG TPA: hypothetical protein VL240_14665 [Candidatus Binatia bacterium]|nr:hypothetical protein [Candidatus Binatia bacterium]
MRKCMVIAGFLALATSLCLAQYGAATPQAGTPAAAAAQQPEVRGAVPVSLAKGLDSKKLKDGDPVICQTTATLHSNSGMLIPSGSKVVGHVTQAQARSKGDAESSLAMVFDKIQLTGGKELPMKGTLQAVAPGLGGGSGPDTGVAGGGQMMPGHGDSSTMAPPSGGAVSGPNSGIHPIATGGSHPILNPESQGVLGFKNLQMDKNSVITSTGKEVKLDSGTQMMIRAEVPVPTQ